MLTHSFATASIKLIPKKGDAERIKNWRPISLLNVLYKVAAKVINNRLKKAAPYCITRSQKGFVDKRFIQECLINIAESVNYAEMTNTESFCLAIDQAKAFDSVNHNFLKHVYKFFGFGDYFVKLITTLTTGRNACIIFDDGSRGAIFPLECGNAQGNAPSPLQFNLADQILIFKIEYSPLIKSIMNHRAVQLRMYGERALGQPAAPDPGAVAEGGEAPGDPQQQQLEGKILGTRDKLKAFADDGTVLARSEECTLNEIVNIVNNFADISGLKCNMDKSTIMLMGYGNAPVPEWVLNSGFKLVRNTSVLGCDISSNIRDLHRNFEKTVNKVAGIKRFWERFNLSLAGRLAFAKSLMLSQVSYLGSIINPSPEQLSILKKLIYNFVQGQLAVAKDKITLEPQFGGLGMIDLDSFIPALQCSWLKRLNNGSPDTYKEIISLARGTDSDSSIFDPAALNKNLWPVLGGIWDSILKFYNNFTKSDNNWEKLPVILNPLLTLGRENRMISRNFFMHNIPAIPPPGSRRV
jgi:hypothetical protein